MERLAYEDTDKRIYVTDPATEDDPQQVRIEWSEGHEPAEDVLRAELAALKARSAEIESALNIVPAWQPGVEVKTGEVYSHGGSNWRVVQDHTTASHWEPGSAGLDALYAEA